MIKKDVIELNAIFKILKEFGETKFKYSVLKNINALKDEISALAEVEKQADEVITDFTKDRNNLILELGKKDDKGNVFIDPKDTETMEEFGKRLTILLDVHKDAVNSYNTKLSEFNEILKEEVEVMPAFRTIPIGQWPEQEISSAQLEKLLEFDIISD